jgi:osmotically inducible protein OsmC
MPQFSRNTTTDWSGTLMEGGGQVKAGTGAFSLPVSFPRRIGDPGGATSPEELIAAAHGACYAMVVAGTLAKNNAKAAKHSVTCTITADKTDAGIKIITSKLSVVVEGLSGMDKDTFIAAAKDAEKGCPVSNALRNSLAIEVDVTVK